MKHILGMLWGAAFVSLIGGGATFAEVHLEAQVAHRLSEVHGELQVAHESTKTLNHQLTRLGAVNQASGALAARLKGTESGTRAIEGGLVSLNGTVTSINSQVTTITKNTNQAARSLTGGLGPTHTVNHELSAVDATNRTILANLSELLSLNQALNRVLKNTNRKLP